MSRLPTPGGGKPQVVSTSTFTTRVPGSNATQTVTRMHTREVQSCRQTAPPGQASVADCGTCGPGPSTSMQTGMSATGFGMATGQSRLQLPRAAIPQRSIPTPSGASRQIIQGPRPQPSSLQSSRVQASGISRAQASAMQASRAQASSVQTSRAQASSVQASRMQTSAQQAPRPVSPPRLQTAAMQEPRVQAAAVQAPRVQAASLQVPGVQSYGLQTPSGLSQATRQIPRPGGSLPRSTTVTQASRLQQPSMMTRSVTQPPRSVQVTARPGVSRLPSTAGPSRSALKQPVQVGLPACPPCASPEELVESVEADAQRQIAHKSAMDVGAAVYAKAMRVDKEIRSTKIDTPAGQEQLLQKTLFKRRVERDEESEKVTKSVSVLQVDEATGQGTEVTMSVQQKDPKFALRKGKKEVVTIQETVTVTPSYTTTTKNVTQEDTRPMPCLDPAEVRKLVDEEKEDVENTLKMAPPDLVLAPDKYHMKKRLQKLRLTSESMVLLEQSLVNPKPAADEVQMETPPETFAGIMHTVEKGMQPQSAPDQIFNTLFTEKSTTEPVITVSSVGPGPLQDVVVPTDLTKQVHGEIMTSEVNKLAERLQNVPAATEVPYVDIFTRVMSDEAKKPKKGKKAKSFKPIQDEELPWGKEDIEPVVNIIGAEPSDVLEACNVVDLETSGNLEKELASGIEYFVDADPIQYMSRVQLRGSQPPPWFPGYIMALPDFPETVRVMRNVDEVFYSGWKSVQPKIFPDESLSIVE